MSAHVLFAALRTKRSAAGGDLSELHARVDGFEHLGGRSTGSPTRRAYAAYAGRGAGVVGRPWDANVPRVTLSDTE